ncbi:type II toxin-antitoxin system RelE/ParE family toxin [Sphingobium sp. DEHP117]|uniref:type II toxin-antitoxin system RelE/ParE family toxin n=1 Tax=Sphingobium sp. DEHP117 TaxID=2993436 RepID=UPI0027D56F47|nr:type II toxin-antitoxin system RelE/ParE family toxin [Sphingobium sp. DEHP117]MDQ4420976.1 type II toxin-antitoxin system RelE/ParE family toxin [Sphingobium sp. DEHP117]
MSHAVSFAPEAEAQLLALFRYIASEASTDIADRYVGAIIEQCEKLESFPLRGTPRDDIRPGLRTLAFRRRRAAPCDRRR